MVQIFINICLGLGLGFLFLRIMRPPKDDPRMSRGLQLLQSKIAVLEDLSDRTDHQVKQLTLLLDEKAKNVQSQIEVAREQIFALNESMKKSREVARIFEDRIPHEEIVDRQNTVKYVRAAQLANQGCTVEEIAKVVDIPISELEFIVKINRDKMMFSVEQLPEWIKEELEVEGAQPSVSQDLLDKAYREAFEPLPKSSDAMSKIGDEFRKAVAEMNFVEAAPQATMQPQVQPPVSAPAPGAQPAPTLAPAFVAAQPVPTPALPPIPAASAAPMTDAEKLIAKAQAQANANAAANGGKTIRPYTFPKVAANPTR